MAKIFRILSVGALLVWLISFFIDFEKPEPQSDRTPAAAKKVSEPKAAVTPTSRPALSGKQAIRLPAPQPAENGHNDFLNRYRDMTPNRSSLPGYDLMRLRAIPKDRYRADLGPRIDEKFGFAIYAAQGQTDLMVDEGLPVVAKNTNGLLGIVTGTLIVTLREGALALDLARDYGLKVIYFDEDLRLAYYSAPEKSSLDSVVDTLKRDRLVESVNLEVIQSRKKF